MNTKKFEITDSDRKIDKAKEHEKEKEYEKAKNEYEEAEIIYRENNDHVRSAKCFVAKNINTIKFHLRGREIVSLSSNNIEFFIEQIEQINSMERLSLLERLEILISSYRELEEIFQNHFMIEKENEMYYSRTSLKYKHYWEQFKTNHTFEQKLKLSFNCLISLLFHTFCGHGEKRWRAFGWMAFTIIIFACIYNCFDLIQFTAYRSDSINFFHALYFSVITFTSLGYGDIIPICFGKTLASIEVLFGLLMFGMLIASLTRKMQK